MALAVWGKSNGCGSRWWGRGIWVWCRGRVFPRFYGDGRQTRAFCYVDDLIDGFVRLMAAADAVTGPVNLGNPVETAIAELAELVIELTGSRSPITRRPLPVDDPTQRCPDITQAAALLGWQSATPLKEGLARTIEYFDRLLAGRQPQPAAGA